MPVLILTPAGLYCPAGDFHIDPLRPVPRALITHGHSDHARTGHGAYLCTASAAPVITHRLRVQPETIAYGDIRQIGGARVSFHPAGHVPGSAQIRIEVAGEVWAVSGDYKIEPDGVCEAFEPVRCHTFITECTFGLPIYRWEPQAAIMGAINAWWSGNRAAGRMSAIAAYSLGKAQRLLAHLDQGIAPILTHPAIEATTAVLRQQGLRLPPTIPATDFDPAHHAGALLLAPPAALSAALSGAFGAAFGAMDCAEVSGWMALPKRRGSAAFVLSDHADWPGLNAAIRQTGAERVLTTHGYSGPFARWLCESGYDAQPLYPERPPERADI